MSNIKAGEVGKITEKVINLLNLHINPDIPIFLGDTNIAHMKANHPSDFGKILKNT